MNVVHLIGFVCLCTEKNKKRDIRDWMSNEHQFNSRIFTVGTEEVPRRGDIPIIHGDCDGKFLIKFISLFTFN